MRTGQQQYTLMRVDPQHGTSRPYPSHAQQYRDYHGITAWIYNPWSGERRDPIDIGSDIEGFLIIPDEEPVKASEI